MNFREPTQVPHGARRAFRALLLMLMSALFPQAMLAGLYVRIEVRAQRPGESFPYLPANGCTPLRFREAPEPETPLRPAAAAPPQPHLSPAESSVVAENAAAQPAPVKATHEDAPAEPAPAASDAPPATSAPISILPDTVRPRLQAEDFLPFFVIPDSAKSAVPVPSEPGKLPPSTATYTEK
jgi:hypothetical protein